MPQGVSYVHEGNESAKPVHKKHNTRRYGEHDLHAPGPIGVGLCAVTSRRPNKGSGLGVGNLRSLEDVFADRCLRRVNVIFCIDVGRVVVTSAAVNVIHSTVRSDDRIVGGTTEQIVLTETAVYAVVTVSAIYHVGTTAAVTIVVAYLTRDRVFGTETVDPVVLIGAREVVPLKSAPYVLGQGHPAEHDHSYQQRP